MPNDNLGYIRKASTSTYIGWTAADPLCAILCYVASVLNSIDIRCFEQRPVCVNQRNDTEYFAHLYFEVLFYVAN